MDRSCELSASENASAFSLNSSSKVQFVQRRDSISSLQLHFLQYCNQCVLCALSGSAMCLCGHPMSDKSEGRHARTPSASGTPPAAWLDDDRCTRAVPTNAFGEIEFQNAGTRAQVSTRSTRVAYSRSAHSTSYECS